MLDSIWIGVLGMLCIILAFLLHFIGEWKENLRRYIALNMAGSALLAFYAFEINSLPFLILNGFLALAALYELAKNKRWKK